MVGTDTTDPPRRVIAEAVVRSEDAPVWERERRSLRIDNCQRVQDLHLLEGYIDEPT